MTVKGITRENTNWSALLKKAGKRKKSLLFGSGLGKRGNIIMKGKKKKKRSLAKGRGGKRNRKLEVRVKTVMAKKARAQAMARGALKIL